MSWNIVSMSLGEALPESPSSVSPTQGRTRTAVPVNTFPRSTALNGPTPDWAMITSEK